jgi:hypothetical protein
VVDVVYDGAVLGNQGAHVGSIRVVHAVDRLDGVVGAAVSSPASVFLLTALALAAALLTSYTSRHGNR